MSPPASTLPELLQQLKRTFSPFERLRILGRAWVLLRQMSPQERLAVASQLGLDNADELVEAIAARSGTKASPVLLSMIDQAQKKGTAHLPQLISDLKDPGKRTERLREGVMAAEAALIAEPAQTPPQRPVVPPPLPTSVLRPPPIPVAAPAPPLVSQPSPPPAAPVPAAVEAAPPAPQAEQEKPSAAPVLAPPRPSPPAPPPSPKPAPEPPAQPTEAAPPVEIEPPLHLTDRFRRLRHMAQEARKLPAPSLRSLVEGFPDGWARRRALVELLRTGSPPALRDALALLDILGSDRDRLWCLGTLADRELTAADREALLAAASSPTARRRLERRMDRG